MTSQSHCNSKMALRSSMCTLEIPATSSGGVEVKRPPFTFLFWWVGGYRSCMGGWMVRILKFWFYVPWISREANARLIAAAPELLMALQELAEAGSEAWGEDRPCVRDARATIAKAIGEQK